MCGIFGYVGENEAIEIALDGIKTLEYRGYDSSGIALFSVENELKLETKVGKVSELSDHIKKKKWQSKMAISHTRWATHGKPSEVNAHPQMDLKQECAVVHNGIIENYAALKKLLEKRGVVFRSETDTEVIPQLISFFYRGDILKAVQKVLRLLKGSFAIAVLHKKHPEEIICATRESPLSIGVGQKEMFVSSDTNAFLKYTRKAIHLRSTEVARLTSTFVEVFDRKLTKVQSEMLNLNTHAEEISKGKFEHFMLKEIFEQPKTIHYAMLSKTDTERGDAIFEEIAMNDSDLKAIQNILILGCGTSYHAGLIGAQMIEEKTPLTVRVEIASEYRYKHLKLQPNTLAIAISQSGETADTLAAVKELKAKGAKVLGICNVLGSSLTREVDFTCFLRAGPEISVASTKAFTSQLTLLSLLALRLARLHQMSQTEGRDFLKKLIALPQFVEKVLMQSDTIDAITKSFVKVEDFFFLGRRLLFPTALEGALKLKEIAYVNANGYPAGEMKHGPIALINEESLTIAFCDDSITFPKMLNNIMEIKARGGKVLAIANESQKEISTVADSVIFVPKISDDLAPFLSTVVAQLFAYHFANARGKDIDRPRNLAKSVTVE